MSYTISDEENDRRHRKRYSYVYYPPDKSGKAYERPTYPAPSESPSVLLTPPLIDFFSSQDVLDHYVKLLKKEGATDLRPEILYESDRAYPTGSVLGLVITAPEKTLMLDALAAQMALDQERVVILRQEYGLVAPTSEVVFETADPEGAIWSSELDVQHEGKSMIYSKMHVGLAPVDWMYKYGLKTTLDIRACPGVRLTHSICVHEAVKGDFSDIKTTATNYNDWGAASDHKSTTTLTKEWGVLTIGDRRWSLFHWTFSPKYREWRTWTYAQYNPYTTASACQPADNASATRITYEKNPTAGRSFRIAVHTQTGENYFKAQEDNGPLYMQPSIYTHAHVGLTPFAPQNRSVFVIHKFCISEIRDVASTSTNPSAILAMVESPLADLGLSHLSPISRMPDVSKRQKIVKQLSARLTKTPKHVRGRSMHDKVRTFILGESEEFRNRSSNYHNAQLHQRFCEMRWRKA